MRTLKVGQQNVPFLEAVEGEWCDAAAKYVVCKSPMQCYQNCSFYKAKGLTGIQVREGILTGFYEGMFLVPIKE